MFLVFIAKALGKHGQLAKLLGIIFIDKMNITENTEQTVGVLNQRLYLQCQLKRPEFAG